MIGPRGGKKQSFGARAPAVRLTRQHQRTNRLRRSEEHTSELQSLMRISYAVFCLKKKTLNSIHILLYTLSLHANTTLIQPLLPPDPIHTNISITQMHKT